MKRKGLKESKIISNLRKARWNSEQVRYVTRKYSKKRTGMLEIPVGKVVEKLKKKSDETSPKRY